MKEVHGNTAYMEKDKRKAYKVKAYRRKQKYTNKAYGGRTGIHEEEEEPCTKTKDWPILQGLRRKIMKTYCKNKAYSGG